MADPIPRTQEKPGPKLGTLGALPSRGGRERERWRKKRETEEREKEREKDKEKRGD